MDITIMVPVRVTVPDVFDVEQIIRGLATVCYDYVEVAPGSLMKRVNKLLVIKMLRGITGWDLKCCKDAVEAVID